MGAIHMNTTGTPLSTVTIHAAGNIDATTAEQLRHALIDVIMRRRPTSFVVDLNAVTAIDAASIGTLRAAHSAAEDVNLRMVFRTARSPLSEQMRREGINDG